MVNNGSEEMISSELYVRVIQHVHSNVRIASLLVDKSGFALASFSSLSCCVNWNCAECKQIFAPLSLIHGVKRLSVCDTPIDLCHGAKRQHFVL